MDRHEPARRTGSEEEQELFAPYPHKGHRMLIRPLIWLWRDPCLRIDGAFHRSAAKSLARGAHHWKCQLSRRELPLSTTLKDART